MTFAFQILQQMDRNLKDADYHFVQICFPINIAMTVTAMIILLVLFSSFMVMNAPVVDCWRWRAHDRRSWVRIQVMPIVGSDILLYVDGASVGTRKMVSLVLGPVSRQVKECGQSHTSSS